MYSEFVANFKGMLSQLPEYDFTEQGEEDLEDGAWKLYTSAIHNKILDFTWSIKVSCKVVGDNKEEARLVILTGSENTYLSTNFALLSRYLYISMGLPEMSDDEFYGKLKFFEDRPVFENAILGDWEITYMAGHDLIFTILKMDNQSGV